MTCLQPLYGISVVYKSHLITHHSVVRVCLPASFIVCLCVCLHVCVFVCLCICLHVCVFFGRWSCLSDLLFFILDIICTMIQFMYNSLFSECLLPVWSRWLGDLWLTRPVSHNRHGWTPRDSSCYKCTWSRLHSHLNCLHQKCIYDINVYMNTWHEHMTQTRNTNTWHEHVTQTRDTNTWHEHEALRPTILWKKVLWSNWAQCHSMFSTWYSTI